MEQIKAILKEHDVAGFVVLHTPGHVEFLNKVNPTYSCAQLEDGQLRMKSKKEDDPDTAAQLDHQRNTCDMLYGISKQIGAHALLYLDASAKLDEHLNATHNESDITSHESQNN